MISIKYQDQISLVKSQEHVSFRALAIVLWAASILLTLYLRPLIPIDETRYASVAWQMWLRHDFIVPHLNGQPYSHKPPLLFWIIQGGWWLFGVHDWVARSIPALFSLGSLFLVERLSRYLWPDDARTAGLSPLVLLGTLYWLLFTSMLMFDMLVGFFTLLGLCGVCQVWRSGARRGWLIFAMAIGGGILAKGPVILVYLLPVALLAPAWIDQHQSERRQWLHWYTGCALALLAGIFIAAVWVIPAAYLGGETFRQEILWSQTSGRIVAAFSHARPWWWYLPLLPLFLYPWLFWLPLWRGLRRYQWDAGARFCASWALPALLILSLVSGKQMHYLLPVFPAVALIVGRVTADPLQRMPYDGWVVGSPILVLGSVLAAIVFLPGSFIEAMELPAWMADIKTYWIAGLLLIVILVGLKLPRYSHATIATLAVGNVVFASIVLYGVMHTAWPYLDTTPMAKRIKSLQDQQVPVAIVSKYHGEFQYTGRLTQPIVSLRRPEVDQWLTNNPDGRLIVYSRSPDACMSSIPGIVEYSQAYRGRFISLLKNKHGKRKAAQMHQVPRVALQTHEYFCSR